MQSFEMKRIAFLVAILFAVVCMLWSVLIPIGEAPDENNHLQYSEYLRVHHRLPDGHTVWSGQAAEGFQPPLYHIVIAALSYLVGFNLDDVHWVSNPLFDTVSTGQPNLYDNAATRAVSRSWALIGFHILRLPNAIFAGLTFWWLWLGLSRLFKSESLALGAVSAWAFMPQTTHMGGVVGNDMLAACLSSLAFLMLIRAGSSSGTREYWKVAVLLGLAIMTKMTGLFVYGGICLTLLLNGTWRRRPRAFLLVAILPVLIGGWAVIRSTQLHIPPIETKWIISLSDGAYLYAKSWIIQFLRAIQSGLWSTIGQPGWGWLVMPTWYYGIYIAAGIVVVQYCRKKKKVRENSERLPAEAIAYLIGCAIFFFMTVYWFRESSERLAGRLFYPFAAGPLALVCWALKDMPRPSMNKTRTIFASISVGVVLVGVSLADARFIGTLGSSMMTWGNLAKSFSHYATVSAMDLSVLGYALCIYGLWLWVARRWWRSMRYGWTVVVIGSVVVNILLLIFRVTPYFS